MEKNWQCPYCGHHQVLSEGVNLITVRMADRVTINSHVSDHLIHGAIVDNSEYSSIAFQLTSISCLNPQCKKLVLQGNLSKKENWNSFKNKYDYAPIKKWQLLPDSIAKPQPDYIPAPIRKDYEEACKIVNLSPNAGAVLARRCLQSMIRDFCKIKEKTLSKEIEKLKTNVKDSKIRSVTEESIQAIDSIRKMGNIGAHMEKPTGILIDIEPQEATLLIQLIETLFKDWYVARNERQQRLKSIQEVTIKKEQQKTFNGKTSHAQN